MIYRNMILAALCVAAAFAEGGTAQNHLAKEVRHEVLLLPRLQVFDDISYQVNGGTVTLTGEVTEPILKTDAGSAVKSIEGVQQVDNQIEVLPASLSDQKLRHNLYLAIYGSDPLSRYAMDVIKPIRIVVKNGHVTLDGVVDSEADKTLAGMRANTVPHVFSVADNLRVEK